MEPLHEYEKTCKHHMCVPPVCLEGLSLECVAGVAPRQEALRERLWLWRIERATRSCVPSLMLVPVVASQVWLTTTKVAELLGVHSPLPPRHPSRSVFEHTHLCAATPGSKDASPCGPLPPSVGTATVARPSRCSFFRAGLGLWREPKPDPEPHIPRARLF